MRLILPVVLLAALAACASGPAVADLPIGVRPTASPGPLAPKVIPFFTTESDPDQLAVLQQLITEYQQLNPHIEVDITLASPASRGRRLLTALASGADLGIFEIEPTLMSDWVEAGYLLPLDEVAQQIGESDFVAGSLLKQNDHVYAVPYAVSVYGLWVRTDLFEQAGLPLPKTYDEVLTAAQRLTHGNVYGIALPAGQNIATVNYFSIFLWQTGGDYFACDGQVAFGQPPALEAVRHWAALAQYAPPGYATWGYGEQIDAFLTGRVAMAIYGGRLGIQLQATHPELTDKVAVIFPPFGTNHVTLGVWSRFAIAAGTQNEVEAKAFLQWLISGDRLLRYDMTLPGHMIPPLKSARVAALKQQNGVWIQPFYDWSTDINHPAMNMGSIRNGEFHRSDNTPPWAWQVFGTPGSVDTMLQAIALGDQDPQSAWTAAVTHLETSVADWKAMHPAWKSPACAP